MYIATRMVSAWATLWCISCEEGIKQQLKVGLLITLKSVSKRNQSAAVFKNGFIVPLLVNK
jgi:hypothetical protein